MPHLYEIHLLDRKETGLQPWKYSGSSYSDNPLYFGSSCHPDYKEHLKISSAKGKVQKIVFKEWTSISPHELRIQESVWQKQNKHKYDILYYNLSDSIHPISDNEYSRRKISITLKQKGITPYSDKTHSTESLAKAKLTKSQKGFRWYHCPHTKDAKLFAIKKGDIPPSTWIPGKKSKVPLEKKIGGQYWEVYKNQNKIWEGQNLKKWATENSLGGLPYNTHSYKQKEVYLTHTISRSKITNTIILDGIDTGLIQRHFSILYGHSASYISEILHKDGLLYKYHILEYKAVKI
jgi:hypothetical protein